jgi:hypothetical protein
VNKLVAGAGGLLAAGVTVLGVVLAPAAVADENGFDSVACAESSVRVQTAAEAAVKAGDDLAKANAVILAGLQANLAAAERVQSDKLKAYQDVVADDGSSPAQIKAALAALTDAQLDVQEAAKALADAAPPSELKDALVAAQANLKVAIERRVKACDFVLPTVTPTPTPSVTVTVTPRPAPRLPSAIDTGFAA